MKNRLEELDSLRGIASLTVLIGHFIGVFTLIQMDTSDLGFSNAINLLKYSPLHIIYAGHEAVILFLVLSGFVLALPYIKGKQKANQAHYEVGKKVRKTIEEIGGTMPENLPTAENIKKIENSQSPHELTTKKKKDE